MIHSLTLLLVIVLVTATNISCFMVSSYLKNSKTRYSSNNLNLQSNHYHQSKFQSYGQSLISQRNKKLNDLLGLGPAEIAVVLVLGLVLFGPETLKSLSKDMGKAAAELKEIPKTFKEGIYYTPLLTT